MQLEVQNLRSQIRGLTEKYKTLLEKVEESGARENAMELELANLKAQMQDYAEGKHTKGKRVTVSDPERTLITTFVRGAIEVAHGGKAFTPSPFPVSESEWPRATAADGQLGDPLMRWDYSLGVNEGVNKQQTATLVNILEHQRTLPTLPYGISLDDIPHYAACSDVYNSVIARLFRNYGSNLQTKAAKEWKSSDHRQQLVDEIARLEGIEDLGEEDTLKLKDWNDELKMKDDAATEVESKTSTNLRSKLKSVSQISMWR